MPKVIETNNTVRDQNNLPKKKKLWAIVVGINNYQDEEITNLQFCDNDAVGLAQVLQKVATQELPTTGAYFDEVEIIVHSNSSELYSWSPIIPPQQDKILASLEILSQARPQDTVLFYFSGHGFYEESIKDTILCLEETSNNNLAGTGLLIKTLLDKIDNSSAKQQLVLLDACHSGGVASQLIDAILRGKKNNPRLYCITACDRDEKSFETSDYKHGIFTYYLLEGLKGKASYSLIKTDDLYHFIARKTQDYISDANELSNLVNGCHIDRFSSFKPQRLVAGDGEFILGVSSNLIEDNRSRGALVLDGFCPSETIVKISQKLAIQGRFAYQPYPNKSESLADSISALLNSSATTTALLYLKGRFETDEEGVWFVFADGIKISRDWLAEQLRDSPVPQQIIILDCHQTSEIDSQIEPLKQPDKFQCIVAASMENDWLSQKFLEIIEQHTQYGLTATNFIKTIQQAFSQLGIDSSSQRDCYRSESGILNLILERGQHLEGIIIDRNFCPYKSLEAFTRKDKDFFFGRESLIDEIINKLETRHFLLVMGASGSGKSSLVQAGVVPRLLNKGFSDSENACNIWILRPGKHPIRELAEVLSQQNLSSQLEGLCKALEQNKLSPKHLEGIVNLGIENLVTCLHQQLQATGILVINQFEELFTNSSDVEQRLFVQLILGAVQSMDGNLKIIVTLRSDFLSSCLEIPELREKVKDEPIFVPSYLTEAEYRQIITNPAKRVGLAVEPELVNVLVEEVVQEKGALPLLEFTLEQLWQNRVGGKLSLEVYQQRIGG
ncbi:MAG: caspase family protein, partial [Xenococcaceae cyanobacterium MO_207.B15]|nr:caspase family protein [Xenococcaceae cyanobacterium MO_207.B15]